MEYQEPDQMEIDTFEQQALVQEVLAIRETTCFIPEQMDYETFNPSLISPSTLSPHSNSVILVIDTNILLSNLNFLIELKTMHFPYISHIFYLIPWIVLQELDYIKVRKPELGNKAWLAISYLHHAFSDKNREVIGQTMEQDLKFIQNLPKYTVNNDDRILHCCLAQSKQVDSNFSLQLLVILFTNDRNLLNKCQVNDVLSVDRKSILGSLRNLTTNQQTKIPPLNSFHSTFPAKTNNNLASSSFNHSNFSPVNVLEIFNHSVSLIKPILSNFIEDRFKFVYSELWLDIIFIKPPWTMRDILALLDKHWFTVFSDYATKPVQKYIIELKDYLTDFETQMPFTNNNKLLLWFETLHTVLSSFSKFIPNISNILSAMSTFKENLANSPLPHDNNLFPTPMQKDTTSIQNVKSTSYQITQPSITLQSTAAPTCQSILHWAFTTIYEFIQRNIKDCHTIVTPNISLIDIYNRDFIILLENFLLTLHHLLKELPNNLTEISLSRFTDSLNSILSFATKNSIAFHSNTIGKLICSVETTHTLQYQLDLFIDIYKTITTT